MKKYLKNTILTVVLGLIDSFAAHSAMAQGEIKMEKESHNFGVINEGVQAKYDFVFTNTGNQPVVIQSVNASCGCTTPFYTKEPIMPNKKGIISASFDSNGRPGVFNKSVSVVSNAKNGNINLTIQGEVKGKTQEQIEASKIILTLEKQSHDFGNIQAGQTVAQKFTVKNTGKADLTISSVQSDCRCVTHTISKNTLKAGETAILELRYTPIGTKQVNNKVNIFSNDNVTGVTQILLSVNIGGVSIMKEKSAQANPFGF